MRPHPSTGRPSPVPPPGDGRPLIFPLAELAALPSAVCRSHAALALVLAFALLPAPASSGSDAPARLDAPLLADQTVALPLGAPWPEGATGLGPGTLLVAKLAGGAYVCTANWAWTDGTAYYLGTAGHCFLAEDETASHGYGRDADVSTVRVRACIAECEFEGTLGFLLRGTTVELGPVAYARQTRDGAQIGNDFGLVRIPDALVGEIRSELPVWGAAKGTRDVRPGDLACLYGNGVGVGETYLTKARIGAGLVALSKGSWRAAMPSSPGDSGAAVASCIVTLEGTRAVGAIGVLTHLSTGGTAGTTMSQAMKLATEAGLTLRPVL